MSSCNGGNRYDDRLGLRLSSIFVIFVGSLLGATFPISATRHKNIGVPWWALFVAKYFGSGVIVATAFIHVGHNLLKPLLSMEFARESTTTKANTRQLLAPAHEALTDPCLTGPITKYSWVEGICLMSVFALFFVELMTLRLTNSGGHGEPHTHGSQRDATYQAPGRISQRDLQEITTTPSESLASNGQKTHVQVQDIEAHHLTESYAAQMTGVFILEFGVVFHSVFIGLTLAVAGKEFNTLYVVLVFHQTFEGLALGSRFASIDWPKSKRWTPYALGIGYAFSTPTAIAVGLGVRSTFHPGSATALITNGVFVGNLSSLA